MIAAALLLALQAQAPADSITLADAVSLALARRAQVSAAAAQVAGARAALRIAGAVPNPGLSYTYSEAVPSNHLILDQPLDWLLRRGGDRDAARAGVSRALADSTVTMSILARDVRVVFWRARAALLSLTLVQEQAAQADTLARFAVARYRSGDISLLEQEQAAQEAARAHQTASAAREGARVALADLARALGTESAPAPVGPLDAGLDEPPAGVLDAASSPVLRAAVADSAAAAATVRSASAGRVPLPTIQGGAEWGDPAQPGALALVGVSDSTPVLAAGGRSARGGAGAGPRGPRLPRHEARLELSAMRPRPGSVSRKRPGAPGSPGIPSSRRPARCVSARCTRTSRARRGSCRCSTPSAASVT